MVKKRIILYIAAFLLLIGLATIIMLIIPHFHFVDDVSLDSPQVRIIIYFFIFLVVLIFAAFDHR